MGTYDDENPNASVGERLVSSVKKIVGIAKDPTKAETKNASSGGETPQETADRMSGGDDSNSASNTGPSGQSSDSWNKY
jgi:hypothetical protein